MCKITRDAHEAGGVGQSPDELSRSGQASGDGTLHTLAGILFDWNRIWRKLVPYRGGSMGAKDPCSNRRTVEVCRILDALAKLAESLKR